MQNIYNDLIAVLKEKKMEYFDNEGNTLKQKIASDGLNLKPELIKVILQNEKLKEHFTVDVDGITVFDKVKFQRFVNNKMYLEESYTQFLNKMGLADANGELLSKKNDVVLVWPYKDCVLQGGQTKEDDKRNEIFYNEILAPDDINRLFEPKAFTNFKYIDKDGEKQLGTFPNKPIIENNFIIKGNNLLALHSLKEIYKGKIKLIYIDPPYNTGNDGFKYNDNFNHSTWLTFMRNRLEVAKELLSEDGAIYINLDFNEVHYAKVLMDEVFGHENFQREIIWRIGWLSGYKTADNNFIRNHDSILFYSKNTKRLDFKKRYIENKDFKRLVKIEKIKDKLNELRISKSVQEDIVNFINHDSRPERYPIEDVWNGNEYDDLNSIAIVSFSGETVSKMLGVTEFKGQKSEKLLERIINSHTSEGEIVLDFQSGTGTTCAVAHKMGRRYIGVEQMDYIENISVERMKKVIAGEQGGISKALNWQGGGSFIYMEIKKQNEEWVEKIQEAKTKEELLDIWKELKESEYLCYKVNPEKDNNKNEIEDLEPDNLKDFLIKVIDKNALYLNYKDIEDEKIGLNEEEINLNKEFYGEKE